MKKIISKISFIAIFTMLFTSCEDNLDQIPFDSFGTDAAYVSAQDFENGVRGVYLQLTSGSYYGGLLLSVPDVASDNTTFSQYGRGTKDQYHNWTYNPSSQNLSGLYNQAYFTIYSANLVLAYAESFEGETKAEIVAELKALRALAHFDIVKNFGKIPTQSGDANGSLGIAYVTEADPNIQPSRETVGAVYTKIVQDLLDARADIAETSEPGRLNKEAVNLLLSRVYLYMGEWQNAIDAANQVTTPVAPRSSVVGVWEDRNQDGLVFYIPNESADNNIGVQWSQGSLNQLTPEYVASYGLFITYANDDIRKEAYIAPATAGGVSVNAIKKLLGRYDNSTGAIVADGVVDFKIFRAAEAYLNKAEALYNLGQEGPARVALDVVRTKRYTSPPSGETGNALRDAIRLERRLEFAFEYQRFYDVKRWGLGFSREGFGDKADGSGIPSIVQNLPAGSYKFQFPIDQSILDRNPNIVQNPGY
tara:strand:+ start:3446 stop:4876 length:1431 start_codon:yes stop_codon:yes gene_type:complete